MKASKRRERAIKYAWGWVGGVASERGGGERGGGASDSEGASEKASKRASGERERASKRGREGGGEGGGWLGGRAPCHRFVRIARSQSCAESGIERGSEGVRASGEGASDLGGGCYSHRR